MFDDGDVEAMALYAGIGDARIDYVTGAAERFHRLNEVSAGDRANFLARQCHWLAQRPCRLDSDLERHIGVDALPLERVWVADHCRLGNIGMRDQYAFHFGGAKPMP